MPWDCFLRTSDWVAHPVQAMRSMDKRKKKRNFFERILAVASLITQFTKAAKNYQEKGTFYGNVEKRGTPVQWVAKLKVRITRTNRVMKENLKSFPRKKYKTERRTRA